MLKLILGRAGSGKSHYFYKTIASELKEKPDGAPLILIVPEQATFQAEYHLSTKEGLVGMIRCQVLSFRRLAWKIMQESGGCSEVFIDDTGKGMIIRKIIEKNMKKLKIYKRPEQAGLLQGLIDFHNELKRSQTTTKKMVEKIEEGKVKNGSEFNNTTYIKDKLNDLNLIMELLDEELSGHYLDAEDYLTVLQKKIPDSSYLQEASIFIDGFYGFTSQEYSIIFALLNKCKDVTVTLCLDKEYGPHSRIEELNPFYNCAVTCRRLMQMQPDDNPVSFVNLNKSEPVPRFQNNPSLSFLEKNLHNYSVAFAVNEKLSIKIASTVNRKAEVEALARKLVQFSRDEKVRWKDMTVTVASLADYSEIIKAVFKGFEIPFFLDQKRDILHHPLAELVRSALEVVSTNWRYESVFRCVKTGFFLPLTKDLEEGKKWQGRMNRLENYVLRFGINGSAWYKDKDWQYNDIDELEEDDTRNIRKEQELSLQEINESKELVSKPLIFLQNELKKSPTVGEKIIALYNFLEKLGVPLKIEQWSEEAVEAGETEKSREHQLVYKSIINLFEQADELIGEEKVSLRVFTRMLESGVESLQLALVPPSLDQVVVGNIERSRLGNVKHSFILGANEGVLPSRPKEDGILAEQEREFFIEEGIELAPGSKRKLLDEQFFLYIAMTRASVGVQISYSLADQEGKALMPSMLINRLHELFPGLKEETILADPDDKMLELEAIDFIVSPRQSLSYLAVQLGKWKQGDNISPLWWDVYNWLVERQSWQSLLRKLIDGINYKNQAENLQAETSKKIYGERLKASVTRLEKFRSCPFSQFLSYGLRLKEREIYRLEIPDIGRFYHVALKNLWQEIVKEEIDLTSLSKKELVTMVEREVDKLTPLLQKRILFSSGRYRYIAYKLKDTLSATVSMLAEHAKKSEYSPYLLEAGFGVKEELPTVAFQPEKDFTVELVGRIDRVDICREENNLFFRIIDYKSGRPQLDITEIYYGLNLQLMIYLDIVSKYFQTEGVKVIPAGLLYLHIHSPVLKAEKPLKESEVSKLLLKAYKMKGLLLADLPSVQKMDTKLNSGYSEIIPVGLKKDGKFYSNSSVISEKDLQLFVNHINKLIHNFVQEILQGKIAINPYNYKKKKACAYCSYKAICQFDLQIPGNYYNNLKALDKYDIIKNLQKRQPENEGQGKGNCCDEE